MSSQWGRIPLEWQDQHREATWGTFQRPGFVKQIRILPSIPKELCCTRSRSPRVARGEIVDAVDGPASFNVDSNDVTRWRAPLGHCGAVAAVNSAPSWALLIERTVRPIWQCPHNNVLTTGLIHNKHDTAGATGMVLLRLCSDGTEGHAPLNLRHVGATPSPALRPQPSITSTPTPNQHARDASPTAARNQPTTSTNAHATGQLHAPTTTPLHTQIAPFMLHFKLSLLGSH